MKPQNRFHSRRKNAAPEVAMGTLGARCITATPAGRVTSASRVLSVTPASWVKIGGSWMELGGSWVEDKGGPKVLPTG